MTIDGQTVSATGPGNFGAYTGSSGIPVDWVGKRLFEHRIIETPTDPVNGGGSIEAVRGMFSVIAVWFANTQNWLFGIKNLLTSGIVGSITVSGAVTDAVAMCIDGETGDASVYQNGTLVMDHTTTPDGGSLTSLEGFFLAGGSDVAILALAVPLGDGFDYSAEIITSGANFRATYADGTLRDWCGNAL